jgi:chemotaxis methyl-accepting protein methylase
MIRATKSRSQTKQEVKIMDTANNQEYLKLTFKRFVELGALTLSVQEFVDIVFPNFSNEINAEFLKIAKEFNATDICSGINDLIDRNEFDHPLILALHKNQLFREIVGPEYSFINRYPKVFEKIYSEVLPSMAIASKQIAASTFPSTDISIALIGSSYGQELITTLKYLFPYLSKPEKLQTQRLTIDILSKPNIIFEKLRNNAILYPKSIIHKYMSQEEVNFYFIEADSENLSFSDFICQNVKFLELDLLDENNLESCDREKYNLILLHNVIQYLEPQTGDTLDFVCRFLDWILKQGGTISIINESKIVNNHIAEPFEQLYQLSGNYSRQVVDNASLYKKIR